MAHHAYYVAGDIDKGIERVRAYAKKELHLSGEHNADITVLRYGLFSVEDARKVGDLARQASVGEGDKVLVIAAGRMFHEAQNALLKLFEEPPEKTVLIVVVPSAGMLIETLHSRLLPLPEKKGIVEDESSSVHDFISATAPAREKLISKLLDKAKSDKDADKQSARLEALQLAEGLSRAAYAARLTGLGNEKSLTAFLTDLDTFIPILHDRSAPLKPIFEHLLLVIPQGLGKA